MKKIYYGIIILLAAGCKELYQSPIKSSITGYLVVEGVINSGPDSTIIKLSRTTSLDSIRAVYEPNAQVLVEGDDNSSYRLFDNGSGKYKAVNLNLNASRKYRLHIRTTEGKEYLSDFEAVKNNPPIDSISYKSENNGLQLFINTHDPLNNTRYYQWEYTETWEFHSDYPSYLSYFYKAIPGGELVHVGFKDSVRFGVDTSISKCWGYNSSSNLLLGSSAKLSKDAINLPIIFIPPASQKLSVLYSIQVNQYSWTKEGYEFLEKMKKNTEGTGSVFDAQPSEIKGNIHCVTDPAEIVIGYFSISPVQKKRIFISVNDVPGWKYESGCTVFEIENISDSIKFKGSGLMPAYVMQSGPFDIKTFAGASPRCVDCTLSGTNLKPSFWP